MRYSTNTPGTISLSFKECFGYGGLVLTAFGICAGVMWNVFTYAGAKFEDLVERQDRLHQETRAYTEKMIDGSAAELDARLAVQIEGISTQIGGISTAINNTQAMIRDQSNVVINQVQQTATNKAELTSVKEKIVEDGLQKQALEKDVEDLQAVVDDITFALQTVPGLNPSNIQPAVGVPSTRIRPAFKP